MSDMDDAITDIGRRMLESRLKQYMDWFNSPRQVALRAKWKAEWDAKPWHEKARIRLRVRFDGARTWLGEKIAGRSFNDD